MENQGTSKRIVASMLQQLQTKKTSKYLQPQHSGAVGLSNYVLTGVRNLEHFILVHIPNSTNGGLSSSVTFSYSSFLADSVHLKYL